MEKDDKSTLISTGHSFGGLMLYSALQGVFTQRYLDSRYKNTEAKAKGYGDLVVIVNPAFEAQRYYDLFTMAQDNCNSYPEQYPKLMILTSETDYATRTAFKIGRYVSVPVFEGHRSMQIDHCTCTGVNCSSDKKPFNYKEFSNDILTVGHAAAFVSHNLKKNTTQSHDDTSLYINPKTGAWSAAGLILEPLSKTRLYNPYYNVQVSRKLIGGHNDIWNKQIQFFVGELIKGIRENKGQGINYSVYCAITRTILWLA